MQIWSASKSSFVDLVDGYTYLPFLSDKFLFMASKDDFLPDPENLSAIMHELTHQLCLQGVFGFVCAYHTALDRAARVFARLEVIAGASVEHPLTFRQLMSFAFLDSQYGDARNPPDDLPSVAESLGLDWWQLATKLGLAYDFYRISHLSNLRIFFNLIHGFRWLLEGLAMFTELDFLPSQRYEAAVGHSCFMESLLLSQMSKLGVIAPPNDLPAQYLLTWISRLGDLVRGTMDNAFFTARLSQRHAGQKWYLYCNSKPYLRPYFVGYLVVKALQQKLAQVDSRLSDPEILLIFLIGYFFNDKRLLDFCISTEGDFFIGSKSSDKEPDGERIFKLRLQKHFEVSIGSLLTANPTYLQAAVDRIVHFEQYTTDFNQIDYAAAICGEEPQTLTQEELVPKLREMLQDFCQKRHTEILQSSFTEPSYTEEEAIRVSNIVKGHALALFDVIRGLYNFFKLGRTRRVLVAYYIDPEEKQALLLFEYPLERTAAFEFWHPKELKSLLPYIKKEGLYVIDLNEKEGGLSHFLDFVESDGGQRTVTPNPERVTELIRDALATGKLCWLEEYDIYDVRGRDKLRVTLIGDLIKVANTVKIMDVPRPAKNQEVVSELSRYFDRTEYWNAISIGVRPDDMHIFEPFPGTEEGILEAVWRAVFPGTAASRKKLEVFWTERKMRLVAPKEDTDARILLSQLCIEDTLQVPQEREATLEAVNRLNQRWSALADIPLITVEEQSNQVLLLRLSL